MHATRNPRRNNRRPPNSSNNSRSVSSDDVFHFFNENEDTVPPSSLQRPQTPNATPSNDLDDHGDEDHQNRSHGDAEDPDDFVDVQIEETSHLDSPPHDLSSVDDTVDDGFFSRYRQEAGTRSMTSSDDSVPSDLDSPSPPPPSPPNRNHNQAAATAFDAVDKLFGSINSRTPPARRRDPVSRSNRVPRVSRDSRAPRDTRDTRNHRSRDDYRSHRSLRDSRDPEPTSNTSDFEQQNDDDTGDGDQLHSADSSSKAIQIDRTTWLADVTARASTTVDSIASSPTHRRRDQEEDHDESPFDVHAVEDVSESTTSQPDDEDWNSHISDTDTRGGRRNRHTQNSTSSRSSSRRSPMSSQYADDDAIPLESATTFHQSTFDTLMKIAREGPSVDTNNNGKRKAPRPSRTTRSNQPQSSSSVFNVLERTNTVRSQSSSAPSSSSSPPLSPSTLPSSSPSPSPAPSSSQSSRSSQRTNRSGEKSESSKSDVSHLLGLTKQILSGQRDRPRSGDGRDYEPMDDEMEKSIELKGKLIAKNIRRRFTAVRRVGANTRRILSRPNEWRPFSEDDVSRVMPDYRALNTGAVTNAGNGKGPQLPPGVISGCPECMATGLETCAICLGEGWIAPLNEYLSDQKSDQERSAVMQEIWSQPNLVVNTSGEAQCVRCNGVGKQFCRGCKGSGSSNTKGFNLSDKYKVFDMFPGTPDGPSLDDIDFEHDDDDFEDEDEDEEDGLESFQLYQGSPESYDIRKSRRSSDDEDDNDEEDDDDVDDVIEVEDESEELLATLEAMHVADVERRNSTLNQRAALRRMNLDEDDDDDVDVDSEDEGYDLDLDEDQGDDTELESDVLDGHAQLDGVDLEDDVELVADDDDDLERDDLEAVVDLEDDVDDVDDLDVDDLDGTNDLEDEEDLDEVDLDEHS